MLDSIASKLKTHHQRYPLRWHLSSLFIIKVLVLYLIWLAWFSHPVRLTPQLVSQQLMMSSPVSTCPTKKEACNAAQP